MPINKRSMPKNIKTIQLGKSRIGGANPTFIVAEVANTHEGDFNTAKRMVDLIKDTGVDAVKFQLHIADAEMLPSHPKFETTKKRSLTADQIAYLKKYSETNGLTFLCTPFSREAIDILVDIGMDSIKIGSGEASDPGFLEHAARKKKPLIVSTGMATKNQIGGMASLLNKHKVSYMFLHTVSKYPPEYKDLNLGYIKKMQKMYDVPVGFSDHLPEIYSSIAAVSHGASMIEKHYTLDRNQVGTSDHKVSLEPAEFKEMVSAIRKVEKAGGTIKIINREEEMVKAWANHSVVSVCDIKQGQRIKAELITTKRPLYDGIPAHNMHDLIGRKAKINIKKDSIIKWDYVN